MAAGISAGSRNGNATPKGNHPAPAPQAPPLPAMETPRVLPPPESVDGLSKAEQEFRDKNPAVRREILKKEMRDVSMEVARVANVNETKGRWSLSRRIEMTGEIPAVSEHLPQTIVWGSVRAIVSLDLEGGAVPFYESLVSIGRMANGDDIVAVRPMGSDTKAIGTAPRRDSTEITMAAAAARLELERLTKLYIEHVLKNPENPH